MLGLSHTCRAPARLVPISYVVTAYAYEGCCDFSSLCEPGVP